MFVHSTVSLHFSSQFWKNLLPNSFRYLSDSGGKNSHHASVSQSQPKHGFNFTLHVHGNNYHPKGIVLYTQIWLAFIIFHLVNGKFKHIPLEIKLCKKILTDSFIGNLNMLEKVKWTLFLKKILTDSFVGNLNMLEKVEWTLFLGRKEYTFAKALQ